MGLDMYLKARRAHYVSRFDGSDFDKPSEFSEALKKVPVPKAFDCSFPEVVECEAIYWRKANAIHRWFVQSVQDGEDDCRSYPVSEKELQALLYTVKEVLADRSKAEELLPTESGFFFGGTEYDEGYWQDLEYTDKRLTAILGMPEDEFKQWEFSYCASW